MASPSQRHRRRRASFAAAVKAVRAATQRPLILMAHDPAVAEAGLAAGSLAGQPGEAPLLYGADPGQLGGHGRPGRQSTRPPWWSAAATLDDLADLTEKIKAEGVEDLVLDPGVRGLSGDAGLRYPDPPPGAQEELPRRWATRSSPSRRSDDPDEAPGRAGHRQVRRLRRAATSSPAETVYPLLVLRQNIYTDPQKPIQVQPGLYEINNPKPDVAAAGHHQLLHHLLQRRQRSRRLGPAGLAAGHRRRRHERADRLGGRQVRRRAHRQGGQDLRRRRQGQPQARSSCPATSPCSPASWKTSCPAGKSASARAKPSTSPSS